MVLMDALVLVVCGLYNLFGGTLNLGVLELELEESDADAASTEKT